ncbi:uncharacterized protein TNCV_2474001 [Trichonephila clavipes]|nr:uncharacterized protein TNCV_2474001 [Trichonephila clavipes]
MVSFGFSLLNAFGAIFCKSCGSPVVKVSDHGRHVMNSSPIPLNTRRVGQRCRLKLLRDETSSHWCGVVGEEDASSGVVHALDRGSKLHSPSPKTLV